tara:strand:- start:2148 stop:3686 length:1539 start_codon:yes stop_codon:yes gene_type:complete
MRITKEKKPLDKLYSRRNRYELQPDYQRDKVWSKDGKQKLLDSILKQWDIPKVYLHVVDEENFDVVDGQQRLSTVYEFYGNEIELSDDYSGEYGGLSYEDLPDKIKDLFDDYEIDIVLIEDATEEELKELFARLQLGKALNSGEKLNAIHGNLRDFIKELIENKFFKKTISLKNTRHSHMSLAGQLCILGIKGIDNLKFKDIESLLSSNVNFNSNSNQGKNITQIVNFLASSFYDETKIFKNKASITTLFALLITMKSNGFSLSQKENKNKIVEFYYEFTEQLRVEIEKGAKSKNPEFVFYQSNVTQGADSITALKNRLSIIITKLVTKFPEYQKYFELQKTELELIELKRNETIKNLSNEVIEEITEINSIYKGINKVDLFKNTNENLKGSIKISKPVVDSENFKNLIDSLYKLVYEGSGSLSRVPDELLLDDSIYFDIKHLRTDFFHDVEHGKEKKIQAKQEVIAKIFKKYTGKNSLEELEIGDLIRFQKSLYKNLRTELDTLKTKIKSA